MKNTKSEYLNPRQALSKKSHIPNVYNLEFIISSLFSISKLDISILSDHRECVV